MSSLSSSSVSSAGGIPDEELSGILEDLESALEKLLEAIRELMENVTND